MQSGYDAAGETLEYFGVEHGNHQCCLAANTLITVVSFVNVLHGSDRNVLFNVSKFEEAIGEDNRALGSVDTDGDAATVMSPGKESPNTRQYLILIL